MFTRISAAKDGKRLFGMFNQIGISFGFKIFFYKSEAVIHAHNQTLSLSCCYIAAQLTLFGIFLVQRRPAYQMEY